MKLKRVKALLTLVTYLITACGLMLASPVPASAANTPRIAVDYVPKSGEGRYITGHIWSNDGSLKYTDYSITMALEVTSGGYIWAPKPTFAEPSVPVESDGTFVCTFATGGSDIIAETLYVYLVPHGFIPNTLTETIAYAIDTAIIRRDSAGGIHIQQASGEIVTSGKNSKNTADNPKLSMCFSPYTNNLSPEMNSPVSQEQIRWQLNLIHPYADTIRLFGVSGELAKSYPIAKHEYGMRIMASCWLPAYASDEEVYKELDALIDLANNDLIDVAIVGSECVYRNDYTADKIIEYIKYVKAHIEDKSIPVTTSDTYDTFMNSPRLINACDIVMFTCYPFFNGTAAGKAGDSLQQAYNNLKQRAPNKQIIVSETGWPDAGSPEGEAVPSSENARVYFEDVYNWSRNEGVEVVFFSQSDEQWKKEGKNNDVGSHWGHFTSSGILKQSYAPIYDRISHEPVKDTAKAEWAHTAILELVKKGIISPDGPSIFNPTHAIKRGVMMHYLANTLDLQKITGVSTPTFADAYPGIYYYYTIGSAQKAGLVLGTGNNLCQPDNNITRQDLFVLIYRAMKYAGMEVIPDPASMSKFADQAKVSAYAVEAISALVKAKIIAGDAENGKLYINPTANATRAEAAVLLYRIYQYKNAQVR